MRQLILIIIKDSEAALFNHIEHIPYTSHIEAVTSLIKRL